MLTISLSQPDDHTADSQVWMNMRANIVLLVLLVCFSVMLSTGTASAQTERAAKGVLTAAARGVLQTGAAITVRPPDNTSESIQLRNRIADELERRGFAVEEKAPLVLSFWIDRMAGAGTGKKRTLELGGKGGSESKPDVALRLNVPILGKKPTDSKPAQQNRLVLILADRRDDRVWEAQLVAASTSADLLATVSSLVPGVMDHLGRSVQAKTVP